MPWQLTGNISSPANYLGTRNNQPLIVKTQNQEALRVDSAGKVGIGTTTPQNMLLVGPGSSSIMPSRINSVVASQGPDAGIAIAQNSGVNVLLQASGAGGYIGTTSNHPVVFVLLALAFVVSTITLGTGRTHLMQGAVHLVMFAAFLFLTLVP